MATHLCGKIDEVTCGKNIVAKVLLFDPSTGAGGGQRWSQDFRKWLARRHNVTFVGNGEPLPSEMFDYAFDMRPTGMPIIARKHFTWCHFPLTDTKSELFHRTTVISSSKWSADQATRAWGGQSVVLPLFGECRSPINRGKGILFLGRLTVPKGAARAIEMCEPFKGLTNVTIAGATWGTPPDLLAHLRSECERLGFTLWENPSDPEIDDLYSIHHVFIQTAGWQAGPAEAFGLAAADAYLSGLNVVAYPAGAIVEWLPKDHWAESKETFVAKIKSALEDVYVPNLDVCLNISEYGFRSRVEEALPCLLKS